MRIKVVIFSLKKKYLSLQNEHTSFFPWLKYISWQSYCHVVMTEVTEHVNMLTSLHHHHIQTTNVGITHEVITTSFSKSLPSQKLHKQRWCACLDSIALVTYHYTVEDSKPIYISCLSAYLVPKGVSILWGTLCVSSRTYSHIARRGRHNRSWNEGLCFWRETKS